jgi:hypothetical protein
VETQIPENLADISAEELSNIEAALVAEFDALHDAGTNDVATMTEIAEAIESVRVEIGARIEKAAADAEAIAALADKVRPAVEEPVAEEIAEEAPIAEEISETEETITPEVAETEEIVEERELVTASAEVTRKAPSAKAVSARTPQPEAPAPSPEVVITAAADIPGYSSGGTLDTLALAKAMHAKARTLSNHSGNIPVASINLPIEHKLGADAAYNMDVIKAATAPSALTAAGWCAPSNNLYTLFGVDAGDGLIDLPTVQVTRGGLNVPSRSSVSVRLTTHCGLGMRTTKMTQTAVEKPPSHV